MDKNLNLLPGGVPGNKGGTGRPKTAVREACQLAFDERIPRLKEIADDPNTPHKEFLACMDMFGKYGGLQQIDATSNDKPITSAGVEGVMALLEAARERRDRGDSSSGDSEE